MAPFRGAFEKAAEMHKYSVIISVASSAFSVQDVHPLDPSGNN